MDMPFWAPRGGLMPGDGRPSHRPERPPGHAAPDPTLPQNTSGTNVWSVSGGRT